MGPGAGGGWGCETVQGPIGVAPSTVKAAKTREKGLPKRAGKAAKTREQGRKSMKKGRENARKEGGKNAQRQGAKTRGGRQHKTWCCAAARDLLEASRSSIEAL